MVWSVPKPDHHGLTTPDSIAAALGALRRRVRDAALEGLARRDLGYRLFQKLGRLYGIYEIRVAGEYGLIEGALADSGVLQVYARTGRWAQTANRFFSDLFERAGGGTYIDVGANIGLTTIPIAQNPNVVCKAFEPAPQNFGYLMGNVQANCPYTNVELFAAALFDRRATLDFSLSAQNSGDNRVLEGERDACARIVKVRAERLDDVLDVSGLPSPLAVKLVAQGCEARIIAGGQRTLAQAEAVVLEFDPGLILKLGSGTVTTNYLAANFGQAAFVAGRRSETHPEPMRLDWRPIAHIVDEMRAKIARAQAPGLAYDYIYARR
jgi:FkbM family methyltransferase